MRRLGLILGLMLVLLALANQSRAQQRTGTPWSMESLSGAPEGVIWSNGMFFASHGVKLTYGDAVLTADQFIGSTSNSEPFEVVADGKVRIQQGAQIWVSEHIRYNFVTRQMEAEQF